MLRGIQLSRVRLAPGPTRGLGQMKGAGAGPVQDTLSHWTRSVAQTAFQPTLRKL
jgi:hypothetical protein